MPPIDRERIGVAFDMQGCPNRCRHCWLGSAGARTLGEADVRREVARLRGFLARGTTPVRELRVSTWFREPDYRDDYRYLHDLEAELSDGDPARYGDPAGRRVYTDSDDLLSLYRARWCEGEWRGG